VPKSADWPAHGSELRAWTPSGRGPKPDRVFTEVVVSLPPMIAAETYTARSDTAELLEDAARDIRALELTSGAKLGALGQFLVRTESVSSSKIESIEAKTDDYARALAGIKSNASATSMAAAASAIQQMIDSAGTTGMIRLEDVLVAHEILMRDDVLDGRYAGQFRTMQNWIGGSDYSPRGAVHVPPPPEMVSDYMVDLVTFANRDDISAVAQAAIVHAQFESIHPFTDGNGRIGRALINAVLRRRGLTTRTITPLASAMVADRQNYFSLVNNYRRGDLDPFVRSVAISAQISSLAAADSADELGKLPELWLSRTSARAGSAARAIIAVLLQHPVLSAAAAHALVGGTESSVYSAMDRLEGDGIIHEVTDRKRDKVWAATAVLDEMVTLADRIERDVRDDVT